MNHRTLIIGCGNIAGNLDIDQIDSDLEPLTHAKAYKKNENFNVVACVEPDDERRINFQKLWSLNQSFSTLEEAIEKKIEIDVVSICSPTSCHKEDLERTLLLNPKLVFCEKPLHTNVSETENLINMYKENNVHLLVNYNRRFDPCVVNFKKSIINEEYGKLRAIHGWYNKGLLNNGSHLLDLLDFLFGQLTLKSIGAGIFDFDLKDLSYPLFLSNKEKVPISLSCGNAYDFSLFELEFLFSEGRVKMLNGGRNWSVEILTKDKIFAGYKILGESKVTDGNYLQSFKNVVSHIHDCLDAQVELKSSGEDSLRIIYLCNEIIEGSKKK